MGKNLIETEIERAKNSIKICRSNVENQNKKLRELYSRITNIQNKLDKDESSSLGEHTKIIDMQNRLKFLVIGQKSLVNELESELKIAEDKLQRLMKDVLK